MNIALLGAGAWGTALATALAPRQSVLLWARSPEQCAELSATRRNAHYLPGIALDPALLFTSQLSEAVAHARNGLLIIATPMAGAAPNVACLKR